MIDETSDEGDDTNRGDDDAKDEELELDWGDALESWELEVDRQAMAESSPFPAGPPPVPRRSPPPPPPAPTAAPSLLPKAPSLTAMVRPASIPAPSAAPSARAPTSAPPAADSSAPAPGSARPRMYQPPTPDELARAARTKKAAFDPFGDEGSPTKATEIPRELLEASIQANTIAPPSYERTLATIERATVRPVLRDEELSDDELRDDEVPEYLEDDDAPEYVADEGPRTVPAPPSGSTPVLEVLVESGELIVEEHALSPADAERHARVARLESLARRTSGERAADLLGSAAELLEELGDLDGAESRYERALAEAPKHAPTLRALTRLALAGGDLPRYVQLLERTAALALPASERARVKSRLALARWVLEQDVERALEDVREAQRLAPEQLASALLRARIEAAHQPADLDAALLPVVERTRDRALAGALSVAAGRALELRGDVAGARALFARAAADDPYSFDAQLSLARTDDALGSYGAAARSLLRTLESFDIGPVAEAVRRRSAQLLARDGEREEAVELLEHASDDISLRTAAQIADGSDDRALKLRATEAWMLGTHGAERALALLAHAELLAESGDLVRAESTLELAALADPNQSLVAVSREALARRSGDPALLAAVAASDEAGRGALAAAAKLALTGRTSAEELTWLLEAAEEESGVFAHRLALDASGELGRDDERRRLLRAEALRGASDGRVRALLALAQLERQRGDDEARRHALREAAELAPTDAVVLRALARARPPVEALAQSHRREAEATTGARAASLYLREAFALPDRPSERLAALACAYDVAPDYAPASWALHREARRQGDLARLAELHTSEAARAEEPSTRAGQLVRAALIGAANDSAAAAVQLTDAFTLRPEDPVLSTLVVRLGQTAPAPMRAAALDLMASRLAEPFRRPHVLAAASTLEDAGQYEEARARYESVLASYPDDVIASAGVLRVAEVGVAREDLLALVRQAVDEASTESARSDALARQLLVEPDRERATDAARALSVLSPSHPLALRVLERSAMQRGDAAALGTFERELTATTRGARDRAARLRLSHVLAASTQATEGELAELDRAVIAAAGAARESVWLSRQLVSATVAQGERELLLRALELSQQQASEPVERGSLAVQRAWLTLREAPEQAELLLVDALDADPDHPTALELLGEVKRMRRDYEGAAECFERAAERALSDPRSAQLWMRAAELYGSELKYPERARKALQRAAGKDLDAPGVRERLAELLTQQGDVDGLITLTNALIDRGDVSDPLTELRGKLANLHDQRGDKDAAVRTLRDALSHAPESLPLWRDLARLSEKSGSHGERIEALNTIARLSRDPLELRDTFLALGQVYERDVPNLESAEAAYERVLRLGPRNPTALERLAHIYKQQGKHELAIQTLTQLARHTNEGIQRRDVTLELAASKEQHGDYRGAEELLEALRRATPTDHELLRGITRLLRKTHAHAGLAMHLSRAVNDLRHAIGNRFDDPALWRALVDMLRERERYEVASQCAATALALGIDDPDLASERRIEGDGLGAAGLSELLDDLVFPDSAPTSLRILFRYAAETLNRIAPLDLRVLGAERLDKRHPLRAVVAEQARWVAHREIEVYASAALPYAFVPIQESPIQLLVGERLLDGLSRIEQHFLVARALKIARSCMSITCRLDPREMELLLHALVRSQVATHAPTFLDQAVLDDTARRIGKQLSRRAQTELVPHVLELTYGGVPRFDAASVYGSASTAGSRAALLATGDIDAALGALIKLSGAVHEGTMRANAVELVDEARELVPFAIGESYFEARARAGKEAR